jgi:transcriptional antiterminator
MLVLWYLNPSWEKKDALDIAMYLSYKPNGFTTFTINKWNVERLVEDVYNMELDEPPRNKLRKIVFKQFTGLDKIDKLRIVGKLIGRLKGVDSTDIYEAMLQINYEGDKIIISKLAKMLNVTPRTIYRRMNKYPALKQEKEILNEET